MINRRKIVNTNRLLLGFWLIFLTYYTYLKYFSGFDTWNAEYALQVAILVVVTAIIPYYVARWITLKQVEIKRLVIELMLPVILCAIGYTLFYYTRVKPNFPDVTLEQVMPRSLFPGISISLILLMHRLKKN
jgi:hypothetical protein